MQDKVLIDGTLKARRLGRECLGWFCCWLTRRVPLFVLVVRAVVLVMFELRAELFFQVIFSLVNFLLEAVAGIVTNVWCGFRRFGRALCFFFLIRLTQLLQTGRCPSRMLELLVWQLRKLQRLVTLVQ